MTHYHLVSEPSSYPILADVEAWLRIAHFASQHDAHLIHCYPTSSISLEPDSCFHKCVGSISFRGFPNSLEVLRLN